MMPSRKYNNQNWLPSIFNDFFDNDWMVRTNATAPAINVIENDKEYNALSVITQYRCDVKKVMDVSRRVFWPSPNVDSMVIQFSFHHKYHLEDENYFFDLVKACFTQRRKTIYNNFQNFVKDKALAKELLEKVNIDPSTRAQQCTLEDFIRLYEVTYESTGKGKN